MMAHSGNRTAGLVVTLTLVTICTAQAGQPVIHGIISQGFLKSTDYNYLIPSEQGSFAMNEVMLNVSTAVSNNLRVGAQITARNLGADGNEDMVLDWAYGDYRVRDELGLRIGKVKTPFGFYNQTRDVDMVRNSILLPQSVYTEIMRDVMNAFEGIDVYGTISLGESSSLEYDGFVGSVDVERTEFPVGIMLQPMFRQMWGSYLPMAGWKAETKTIYGGALRWNTPLEGLRTGATIFDGELTGSGSFSTPMGFMTPTFHMHASPWYVLSAEYTAEKLVAAFEFNRSFVDMELTDVLVPTGMAEPAAMIMDFAPQDRRGGWYGQATWQFNDWFQFGSYYSQYYPDYQVRDGEGFDWKQTDLALTARFDLTDYWLVKVEGHAISGTGDVLQDLNQGNPMETENWSLFGVKSTFFF